MLTYNITESIQLAVEHAVDMEDMTACLKGNLPTLRILFSCTFSLQNPQIDPSHAAKILFPVCFENIQHEIIIN